MDKITESLFKEFSSEHDVDSLDEPKRFEHFASYVVVRGEHSESFDTNDLVVGGGKTGQSQGSDTGIDGIAIIANGFLITDVEELQEHIEDNLSRTGTCSVLEVQNACR